MVFTKEHQFDLWNTVNSDNIFTYNFEQLQLFL